MWNVFKDDNQAVNYEITGKKVKLHILKKSLVATHISGTTLICSPQKMGNLVNKCARRRVAHLQVSEWQCYILVRRRPAHKSVKTITSHERRELLLPVC